MRTQRLRLYFESTRMSANRSRNKSTKLRLPLWKNKSIMIIDTGVIRTGPFDNFYFHVFKQTKHSLGCNDYYIRNSIILCSCGHTATPKMPIQWCSCVCSLYSFSRKNVLFLSSFAAGPPSRAATHGSWAFAEQHLFMYPPSCRASQFFPRSFRLYAEILSVEETRHLHLQTKNQKGWTVRVRGHICPECNTYGVAAICRPVKIIGHFCKRAL